MISILVPCYNFYPLDTIQKLSDDLINIGNEENEILLWDDCSSDEFSHKIGTLGQLPYVKYHRCETNLGRAKIRNAMAEQAANEWVLFLDADGLPKKTNFIGKYLVHMQGSRVVCGGREYQRKAPEFKYFLHWYYGWKYESKRAKDRSADPYFGFHSNNFLMPKSLFQSINFTPITDGYGHEDTWFGKQLKKQKVSVLHIENPVIHLGLESREDFLEKSGMACENLAKLIKAEELHFDDTRLSKFYRKLQKYKVARVFLFIASVRLSYWTRNLTKNKKPSLRIFNLYKLFFFALEMRK